MFLHVDIIMVVHVHSAIWLFILMKKISKIQFCLMFLHVHVHVDEYTQSLLTTVCRDRPMKVS